MMEEGAGPRGTWALASCLGLKRTEWALLLLVSALVLAAELINTAIERAVDLACGGELHPLAKLAKDTASGAVLVCAAAAAAVGIIIMGPPLWRLLVT
ncbi:diacylglycerol kinase family protein [Paenibacillus sp. P22]|uniref:diacylglycerol kinase family protein n=1 Tax=Paenibacillus sp. P22 TaxID=483908 RepID=UPI0009F828C1|nr:diacylglycerol kinase family protein [Paenibacillus sp. P22]